MPGTENTEDLGTIFTASAKLVVNPTFDTSTLQAAELELFNKLKVSVEKANEQIGEYSKRKKGSTDFGPSSLAFKAITDSIALFKEFLKATNLITVELDKLEQAHAKVKNRRSAPISSSVPTEGASTLTGSTPRIKHVLPRRQIDSMTQADLEESIKSTKAALDLGVIDDDDKRKYRKALKDLTVALEKLKSATEQSAVQTNKNTKEEAEATDNVNNAKKQQAKTIRKETRTKAPEPEGIITDDSTGTRRTKSKQEKLNDARMLSAIEIAKNAPLVQGDLTNVPNKAGATPDVIKPLYDKLNPEVTKTVKILQEFEEEFKKIVPELDEFDALHLAVVYAKDHLKLFGKGTTELVKAENELARKLDIAATTIALQRMPGKDINAKLMSEDFVSKKTAAIGEVTTRANLIKDSNLTEVDKVVLASTSIFKEIKETATLENRKLTGADAIAKRLKKYGLANDVEEVANDIKKIYDTLLASKPDLSNARAMNQAIHDQAEIAKNLITPQQIAALRTVSAIELSKKYAGISGASTVSGVDPSHKDLKYPKFVSSKDLSTEGISKQIELIYSNLATKIPDETKRFQVAVRQVTRALEEEKKNLLRVEKAEHALSDVEDDLAAVLKMQVLAARKYLASQVLAKYGANYTGANVKSVSSDLIRDRKKADADNERLLKSIIGIVNKRGFDSSLKGNVEGVRAEILRRQSTYQGVEGVSKQGALALAVRDAEKIPAMGNLKQLDANHKSILQTIKENLVTAAKWWLIYRGMNASLAILKSQFRYLVTESIAFYKAQEQQTLGLRGIIDANYKVIDQNNETVKGAQKYSFVLETAKSTWKDLQAIGFSVVGTTADLLEIFNAILPRVSMMGGGLDDAKKLVEGAVLAANAMGISYATARTSIVSILNGNVRMSNAFTAALGYTEKQVKDLIKSNTLIADMQARFAPFAGMVNESTELLGAKLETFRELVGMLGTSIFEPFIVGVKSAITWFQNLIGTVIPATLTSASKFELYPQVKTTLSAIRTSLASLIPYIVKIKDSLSGGDLSSFLIKITNGFVELAKSVATVVSWVTKLGAAISGIGIGSPTVSLGIAAAGLLLHSAYTKSTEALKEHKNQLISLGASFQGIAKKAGSSLNVISLGGPSLGGGYEKNYLDRYAGDVSDGAKKITNAKKPIDEVSSAFKDLGFKMQTAGKLLKEFALNLVSSVGWGIVLTGITLIVNKAIEGIGHMERAKKIYDELRNEQTRGATKVIDPLVDTIKAGNEIETNKQLLALTASDNVGDASKSFLARLQNDLEDRKKLLADKIKLQKEEERVNKEGVDLSSDFAKKLAEQGKKAGKPNTEQDRGVVSKQFASRQNALIKAGAKLKADKQANEIALQVNDALFNEALPIVEGALEKLRTDATARMGAITTLLGPKANGQEEFGVMSASAGISLARIRQIKDAKDIADATARYTVTASPTPEPIDPKWDVRLEKLKSKYEEELAIEGNFVQKIKTLHEDQQLDYKKSLEDQNRSLTREYTLTMSFLKLRDDLANEMINSGDEAEKKRGESLFASTPGDERKALEKMVKGQEELSRLRIKFEKSTEEELRKISSDSEIQKFESALAILELRNQMMLASDEELFRARQELAKQKLFVEVDEQRKTRDRLPEGDQGPATARLKVLSQSYIDLTGQQQIEKDLREFNAQLANKQLAIQLRSLEVQRLQSELDSRKEQGFLTDFAYLKEQGALNEQTIAIKRDEIRLLEEKQQKLSALGSTDSATVSAQLQITSEIRQQNIELNNLINSQYKYNSVLLSAGAIFNSLADFPKEINLEFGNIMGTIGGMMSQLKKAGNLFSSFSKIGLDKRSTDKNGSDLIPGKGGLFGGIKDTFSGMFDKGGKTGAGGLMNQVSGVLGAVNMVGQIAGAAIQIFSLFKGIFSRAAVKIGNQIAKEIGEIQKAYSDGKTNLIKTMQALEQKRTEAITRLSGKKGGQEQLDKLLPELDSALSDLQKQQKSIFDNFNTQVELIREPKGVRQTVSSIEALSKTIKEYIDADGDMAQATEYWKRSIDEMQLDLQDTLAAGEKEAIDRAIELNDLYQQRADIIEKYNEDEMAILTRGSIERQLPNILKAGKELQNLREQKDKDLEAVKKQTDVLSARVQAERDIFGFTTDIAALKAETVRMEIAANAKIISQLKEQFNLLAGGLDQYVAKFNPLNGTGGVFSIGSSTTNNYNLTMGDITVTTTASSYSGAASDFTNSINSYYNKLALQGRA